MDGLLSPRSPKKAPIQKTKPKPAPLRLDSVPAAKPSLPKKPLKPASPVPIKSVKNFAKQTAQSSKLSGIATWAKNTSATTRLIAGVCILLLLVVPFVLVAGNKSTAPLSEHVIIEPVALVEPAELSVTEPVIQTKASPLTGVQVPIETADRPITGIMIENSLEARPQSGLLEAGVVFEAIAESGITRLLAIYQEGQPDYIGPVRSARPYYVEWLTPFDASYAHVGGDIAGKSAIKKYITKDLDQYNLGTVAFTRITERPAPHNVYTDFARLDATNSRLGYTSNNAVTWPRLTSQDEAPAIDAQYVSEITMKISSVYFNPVYKYDSASNTYMRSYNGKPHADERTGNQLSPSVVIAMHSPSSSYESGVDGPRQRYNNIGTGDVWVFQDGTVQTGRWSKQSANEQISFRDSSGEIIKLNAGQTWVTAVNSVDYK